MSPGRRFPEGFLWGTATAAHQVEGGNDGCDWWRFEHEPGRIAGGDVSGVACDHYRRYREDLRMLRELEQNAHRLSVEWSRLEPRPGEFDLRALGHYRDVLGEAREQGLEPMVTLHHFTSPAWFAERGGWSARGSPEAFLPFVRKVVDELGDLVTFWCTVNEPNVYAAQGWLVGTFPPGRTGDARGAWAVLRNLHAAHELAYQEIKGRRPGAQVGLAHNKWVMTPARARNPLDQAAAAAAQAAMDRWPALSGPRLEPVVRASSDFVGLNHYSGEEVLFAPARARAGFIRRRPPPGAPLSDFGWAVRPGWMRRALSELRGLGKPVLVTESGIAAGDDGVRRRYLTAVLREVLLSIEDGVDVRGYFHWTSMDNFEWAQGYSMRFGLIECDRRTLERRPKPSAALFARIAGANSLDVEGAGV
ncbi:MAG: glycoside hydrolase family 1 protein [Candidatus Dormibacterales bacterium]